MNAVKVLMTKGTKMNAKSNAGNTALMLASEAGHTEAMKVLMEKGADFRIQSKNPHPLNPCPYLHLNRNP